MIIEKLADVEFGAELPVFEPDTSLANVQRFGEASGWNSPRFTDHEHARKEGFPGALVPGIMSQGFLAAMIHRWAPRAEIENVDTIFRAPGKPSLRACSWAVKRGEFQPEASPKR